MDSILPRTLAQWRRLYRDGASPADQLESLRGRLQARAQDPAWIAVVSAGALARAVAELQQRAARCADPAEVARALPLYGVPFAVKDNIDVAGVPTTAACPAYERVPEHSAVAVERLVRAGAVCMGKTNLDQFATGLVGSRSPYGRPSSTFDPNRISGGSSSGSAVVVSRGDVAFALGTDTAGSGRVPAGLNNIVGLKPTPGRVSTTGVVPACRTLDCVSVLALTVADAAEVLATIEGADPHDAYSDFQTGPAAFGPVLRVGIPNEPVLDTELAYPGAFDAAVATLRALGHTAVALDFAPLHAVAELLYDGPWVAERHAVVEPLLRSQPQALDPTVRRVIEAATGYSATDLFRAQYALRAAQRDLDSVWQRVDLLMVPTAPTHPTHADVDADPVGTNGRMGTYTNFVNLLGWSALALPAGFTPDGLPFGVTFVAPAHADAALARFGQRWESHLALPAGAPHPMPNAAPNVAPNATPHTPAHAAPLRWPASAATLALAVVGAHLQGLALNAQLTERGATLRERTRTSARYRLFALPNTTPPKPGLLRADDAQPGSAIEVEVWELPAHAVGSFLALVPPPLGLGSLELHDGRWVHGFVCEAHAVVGARDISAFGGWRAFVAHDVARPVS